MLIPFIASSLLGFAPMILFSFIIYWLDRYEKEPLKLLVLTFLWGAIVSAGGAFIINSLFGIGVYLISGSETAANFSVVSIIAPVSEEILKGFAVLLVFLVFRSEFDSILDGIIYAAVAALGFAATENVHYIYSMGYQVNGWEGLMQLSFIRILLVGWQHPFYTAFTGIGIAAARLSKNIFPKLVFPLLGLFVAILAHSFHNTIIPLFIQDDTLAGLVFATQIDWVGWVFMLLFIIGMNYREKPILQKYLKQESEIGVITPEQFTITQSYQLRRRELKKAKKINQECFHNTRKFHQQCAELAHKKHQYSKFGNETNNTELIMSMRNEIVQLSKLLATI